METINAGQGKVFKEKDGDFIFGNQISLGYIYYKNNELLEVPIRLTSQNYLKFLEVVDIGDEENEV